MQSPPLHTHAVMRHTPANRLFAVVYTCGLFALFYHHFLTLFCSTTAGATPTFFSISMLIADVVLATMWITYQAFRMNPIHREVFPQNIKRVAGDRTGFPALDVFICTADPDKEPPMSVVNTALSVMAYDYPPEKLSIYVSDDGGSQLTLFAFMEAAKFAGHWLPYCRTNNITERCPEVHFRSHSTSLPEADSLKVMYDNMKKRIQNVVERGHVCPDLDRQAFSKWNDDFTRHHHPAVVQVVLESKKDKDVLGERMPNLVYVSRQKDRSTPHNFKAGALNVLLRVSAIMTNAPMVLTLDCDMYSNDPETPLQALCYLLDPSSPNLGFVQFPQRFHGLNKNDTYGSELKYIFQIDPAGMDGLLGPIHVGTGGFFRRRAFFGGPLSFVAPEMKELGPDHMANGPIQSEEVIARAEHVAGCNYEVQTKWGSEMGYRYGSLVEDFFTGYRLHCQGWRSVFCNPGRAAFLGDVPLTLDDVLNQTKRWSMGLLDILFNKFSPIIYGLKSMNILPGLCCVHYSLWPIWSIPITIYAFLPQLALINSFPIFPKAWDAWFCLYAFLFLGAYAQDSIEFILAGGGVQRWWNSQRMWIVRGLSSFSFALFEYLLTSFGIYTFGFNVTTKIFDHELTKRYEQEIFEFEVNSPLFLPIITAAIINLFAFFSGMSLFLKNESRGDLFLQIFLAGFAVVNSWPVYEAILLRRDKGKMPMKITLVSILLVWVLYKVSSLAFRV